MDLGVVTYSKLDGDDYQLMRTNYDSFLAFHNLKDRVLLPDGMLMQFGTYYTIYKFVLSCKGINTLDVTNPEQYHQAVLDEIIKTSKLKAKFEAFKAQKLKDNDIFVAVEEFLNSNDVTPHGGTFSIDVNHKLNFFGQETDSSMLDYIKMFVGKSLSVKTWICFLVTLELVHLVSDDGFDIISKDVVKRLRYVCYGALGLGVVLGMTTDIDTFDKESVTDFIFNVLLPSWSRMELSNLDNSSGNQSDDGHFYPQSGVTTGSVFVLSSTLALLSGYMPKNSFVKSLVDLSKTTKSQVDNLTVFMNIMLKSVGDIFMSIGSTNMADYFHVNTIHNPNDRDLIARAESLVQSEDNGLLHMDPGNVKVIEDMICEFERVLASRRDRDYTYRILENTFNKVRSIACSRSIDKYTLSGSRVEPVGILLRGEPAMYKTVLLTRIAQVVTGLTLPTHWLSEFHRNPDNFIYSLPNDKFYDGYTYKKWFAIKDDFGQMRDSPAFQEADAIKIISLINTAEYCLEMAKVDNKNKMYFRSNFVGCTTNLPDWRTISSIASTEALDRRFNIDVKVSISDKYVSEDGRTPDMTKLEALDISDLFDGSKVDPGRARAIPSDFWKLELTTKHAGKASTTRIVTFEELIRAIRDSYHEKVFYYHVNRRSNDLSLNEMLENFKEFDARIQDDIPCGAKFAPGAWPYAIQMDEIGPQSGFMSKLFKTKSDTSSDKSSVNTDKSNKVGAKFRTAWKSAKRKAAIGLLESTRDALRVYPGLVNKLLDKGVEALISSFCHMTDSELDSVVKCLTVNDFEGLATIYSHYFQRCKEQGIEPFDGYKDSTVYNVPNISRWEAFKGSWQLFDHMSGGWLKIICFIGVPALATILGHVCGIFSIFSTKVINKPQSVDGKTQGIGSRVTKAGIPKIGKVSDRIISLRSQYKAQSGLDNLDDIRVNLPPIDLRNHIYAGVNAPIMAKVMRKYLFVVTVSVVTKAHEVKVMRLGHAWNVVGRVFSMPLHFVYTIHDVMEHGDYSTGSVVLSTPTRHTRYTTTPELIMNNFVASEDSANNDCCFFELPVAHANSGGILKFLCTEDDVSYMKRTSATRAMILGTTEADDNLVIRTTSTTASFEEHVVVNNDWDDPSLPSAYRIEGVFTYSGGFGRGDCGSLLTLEGKHFENRCIFGMHVAGNTNRGFSSLITKEMVLAFIEYKYPKDLDNAFVDEEVGDYVDLTAPIEAQSGLAKIGKLKEQYTMSDATKSTIEKSVIHGKLPTPFAIVNHRPARLRPFSKGGTVIDPMEKAFSKYGKEIIHIDKDVLDRAVKDYEQVITQYCVTPSCERTVIPLAEALHSFRCVKPISSSTSAGLPFILSGRNDIKKEYYKALRDGDAERVGKAFNQLNDIINSHIDKYKRKIRPFFAFRDFPKDELRSISKVNEGATRGISGSPFDLVDLFRMYFGAFLSDYIQYNFEVGSAIGVNPYQEWDELSRRLMRFNNTRGDLSIGAGDYSGFDTSQQPIVLDAILQVINRWYGDRKEDNMIRSFLWAEISNSRHVNGNVLYEWMTALPSGNPLTSLINSMYNHIAFRMCYISLGLNDVPFKDRVSLFVLGDDNIFCVREDIRGLFNEQTLVPEMGKIGLTYTNEFKTMAVVPLRPLEACEFLKRKFRFDRVHNFWVGPLNLDSIFKSLNWTKRGHQSHQITVDQLSSTLDELSLHGREIFGLYASALIDLKNKYLKEYEPHRPMFNDYDYVYFRALSLEYVIT